jgi:ABC-type dipeptide/oligopeptide/nickel transport system ATPase component
LRWLRDLFTGRAGFDSGIADVFPHPLSPYIFISHSLPVVARVATRIAVMRAGKFVEVGPAEQVLHQPAHAYTRELLPAVPALPAH